MTRATAARAGADPRAAIRRADRADLTQLAALWIELTEHHAAFEPRFALRTGAEGEVRRLLAAQLEDPDAATFVMGKSDYARLRLAARPSGLPSDSARHDSRLRSPAARCAPSGLALAARPSGLPSDGDGTLLGFCTVRIDRAPPICAEVERAEITDVAVRAAARRRGIGRALVEAALCWARERGTDRVEARVVAGNAEGRQFWTALGFGAFVDVLQRRL